MHRLVYYIHDTVLNPIQAKGHIVPQNHGISSNLLGVRSCCFIAFLAGKFSFRKVQFHQSAVIHVAMATKQQFWELKSPLSFKYFHLRETFCWITFYALDIIKIQKVCSKVILVVSMWKDTRKSLCPYMVIDAKLTDDSHVSQSNISILCHMYPLRGFVNLCKMYLSSSKRVEPCYYSSTDFDGFGSNREQMNITLAP